MDLECRIEGVDCANCAAKLEERSRTRLYSRRIIGGLHL